MNLETSERSAYVSQLSPLVGFSSLPKVRLSSRPLSSLLTASKVALYGVSCYRLLFSFALKLLLAQLSLT